MEMNPFHELPRRARGLILGVLVAGVVVVVSRAADVRQWNARDLIACLALAFACALLEQFTVAIAHESETENYSLTDALWVPALIFARPSVLTFAVLGGVLLGHAARRWAWYKVAYNVAQFVLAITAAQLIYGLFHLSPGLTVMHWVATFVAMLAYFTLNELFIAVVLSFVEEQPLRRLVVLPEGLNLLQAAGNLTIGLLAALVWSTGPVGVPLLVAPMVLSYLAYRGWAHTRQEEQQARERERMRALYEAGRALFGPLDTGLDYRPFLGLVRAMVDAESAELVLVDDRLRVFSSDGTSMADADVDGQPIHLERYVTLRPEVSTHLSTLGAATDGVGLLAVHRGSPWTDAETSLIDALASQVAIRQENERLFHETVAQRSHLADVIGNTSDGIFVASPERRILTWNPAMERITGFSRDAAIGRACDDVLRLHDDDGAVSWSSMGLADSATSGDALLVRSDGSERWIRYTGNAMPDRRGEAKALVVVARDVTAELETERMKSDFVATVSHELRSPLTPLKGFIGSLREGLLEDSPTSRGEYYDIMWRQIERLERLINDLLEVSRIEAGKLEIDVRPLDLTSLLGAWIRESASQTPERTIELTTPTGAVECMADEFRVEQILSNLLSNALKYSPGGSTVDVELRQERGVATVSVYNDGVGIRLEDQPRVFDRFYRVDNGRDRKAGGFGLGLFICRRLVEAMGGEISLESSPGRWCRFTFTLPLIADAASGGADRPAVSTSG
jgi:PAS domain S-box-containing protein